MTRFGFKELEEDTWLEPDFIMHAFVRIGPSGESIRMEAQDWVRLLLAPKLDPSVPEDVQALFEVGRGAMLYGYFFYPLYTLAAEHLFRVAEAAVDHRCDSAAKSVKNGTFYQKLNWLRSHRLIPDNRIGKWQALRELRNAASHPQSQQIMTPGNAVGLLEGISASINELFSGAQQLDGADPASCGKSGLMWDPSAGRAAHLEAVRQKRGWALTVANICANIFAIGSYFPSPFRCILTGSSLQPVGRNERVRDAR